MITQKILSPITYSDASLAGTLQSKLVKPIQNVRLQPIGSPSLPSLTFANGLVNAVKESRQLPPLQTPLAEPQRSQLKLLDKIALSSTNSTKPSQEMLFKGIDELLCFLRRPEVFRTVGLFSLPSSEKMVCKIESLLLEGQKIPETTSLKTACGVLKKLFGEINFPRSFTDGLVRASLSSFECEELVQQGICSFDDCKYFFLLEKVMFFLAKVECYSSINNNTALSLSSIFGPLLIKERDPVQSGDGTLALANKELAANAFRALLSYYTNRLARSGIKNAADCAEREKFSNEFKAQMGIAFGKLSV